MHRSQTNLSFFNLHQLAFVVPLLVYLSLSLLSFNQIEEDAYIYMKTAANIAEGYGYVFNRGDAPVETGSSMLWQLLTVLICFLPGSFIINIKLLGLSVGGLSLLLVRQISISLRPESHHHWLPVLLTAVSVPFVIHNQAGLDYGLTTTVFLFFCWLCIDEQRFRLWPLGALLILVVRSEGFFMLIMLLPVLIIQKQATTRKLIGLAWTTAAFITIEILRLGYFKDFLPNPFYIKMGQGGFDWRILKAFWNVHFFVFLAPIVFIGFLLGDLRNRTYLIVLVFILTNLLWAAISNDFMYWTRRILPAIPLTYLLVSHGFFAITSRIGHCYYRFLVMFMCSSLLILASGFWTTTSPFFASNGKNMHLWLISKLIENPANYLTALATKIENPYTKTWLDTDIKATGALGTNFQALIGKFIHLNYSENITLVYDQMGQTPYFAGLDKTVVDSWGLADRNTGYYYYWQKKHKSTIHSIYSSVLMAMKSALEPNFNFNVDDIQGINYLSSREADLVLASLLIVHKFPDSLTAKFLKYVIESGDYDCPILLYKIVLVCERKGSRHGDYKDPDNLLLKLENMKSIKTLTDKVILP